MSDSAHVRGTVITAFKYTISDQPHPIDVQLHQCIGEFMVSISDVDLVSCVFILIVYEGLKFFRMSGVCRWWHLIQLLIINHL